MRVVAGANREIADWVASHIPMMAANPDFGLSATALGVETSLGEPVAGVVFHNWQPWYGTIEISCAAITSRWLTKKVVSDILTYPFSQLGVNRLTAITPHSGTSASRFLRKLGFRQDAVIREGFGKGLNAEVWGLLAREWRFHPLNERRAVIRGKTSGAHPVRPARRRASSDRIQPADRRDAGLTQ